MRTASIFSLVATALGLAGCDNKQASETAEVPNSNSHLSSISFASARGLTADELSRASKFPTKDYKTDENTKNYMSATTNNPVDNGQFRNSATYQLEGEYQAGVNDGNGENLYVFFDSVGPAIFDEEAEKNPPLYASRFRLCKTIRCDSGVITTHKLSPSTMTRWMPNEIIYSDVTNDGIKDVVFMWETGSLIFQGRKT